MAHTGRIYERGHIYYVAVSVGRPRISRERTIIGLGGRGTLAGQTST